MKALTIIALILLILPASIMAQPTVGVYFTYAPFNIYYYPTYVGEVFDGYLFAHNVGCYLSAIEFQLLIGHPGIQLSGTDLLEGSISLGDPLSGMSITFWPPLDGWMPGYNLLCTFHFLAIEYCEEFGGTLVDVPITVGPHPDTGGVRGTCWPDNNLFDFIGLTAVICPFGTPTDEQSWGAIKSMIE